MNKQEKIEKWLRMIETPSTIKLTRTKEVSEITNETLKTMLESTYSSDSGISNLIATFTNAVATHQRATFIMSKRVMDRLIENDPNTKATVCKSTTYRDFLQKCISDNIIVVLRKQIGRKAGLYEVVDELIVEVLYQLNGKDYYNAQKTVSIEFHDNSDEPGNRLKDFSIEEVNESLKSGKLKVKK